MQTSAFEVYVLGLLAVLERLPVPIAIAFDPRCERVQGNRAFRHLTGTASIENPALVQPMRRAAMDGGDVLDLPMELVRPNGERAALMASAWPLRDEDGCVQGCISVFTDVTQSTQAEQRAEQAMHALMESERRYRLITEAMAEFVWLDAPDGSAIYSNKRWLDYTGLREEENAGLGWQSVVHPADLSRLQSERERTLQSGDPYEGECRYRGKDGKYRWFLFRSIAVRDEAGRITSWLGTATDIDNQKRAEAQQAFFARASDVLSSTLDVGSTLERIARLAIDSLGTWCQIDLIDPEGRLRVAVVAHQNAEKQEILKELAGEHVYDMDSPFGPPHVVRSNQPQLLPRVHEDAVKVAIPDPAHRDVYHRVGYAGGLMVPLRGADRVLGVLGIATDETTRLYTDFDVATALELGRRGASALENAQSYAREHRVATTLQRALLPAVLPSTPHVRFHSAYASETFDEGEAVGGDWYDAFPLGEQLIAVSMGDVAGHGVNAAVTMSTVRQTIRAAALGGHRPAEVLDRANATIALDRRTSMVTALFGIYDTAARTFTYALAGHPRPLLVDDLGELRMLHGSGPPLSDAFDIALCDEETVSIPGPATLVCYTDGLIEFERDLVRAGARLEKAVRERYFLAEKQPAQAIIDLVLDAPQRDDIAVLVMRIEDPHARELRVSMPSQARSAPVLRERLRAFAVANGLDEDDAHRVLNAAGEAIANAIEHAYTGAPGLVTLAAAFEGGRLSVEVSDNGTWREAAPAEGGMRGRGRTIMQSLAPELEILTPAHGTTVRMRF